jgi:asparagine synthase (glutamine-hydrolysing)
MCGIFAALGSTSETLESCSNTIQHRGPDHTSFTQVTPTVALGFHRLAINDLTDNGNQPLTHPDYPHSWLICNGEIYNHRQLVSTYDLKPRSGSDCEVILLLYHKIGMEETLRQLDGYFALVLVDGSETYVARDPIGVRSLYIGTKQDQVYVASELKAIHTLCDTIQLFPPSSMWKYSDRSYTSYLDICKAPIIEDTYETAVTNVRTLLEQAVEKRVDNTERPIGCLLSGGLDSSIICALVQQCSLRRTGKPIHTFSIGMAGSTDVKFARMVAEHLQTIHHEVIVTKEQMLAAIPEVIRTIESYDTTTVRASTPMWLLSEYISKNTDIRVVFSGEGSDELSGSYLYFYHAPSDEEFYQETVRLTRELHYFDVLRCDKSISRHGLEARVPFLDKAFIHYYLHLLPEHKRPTKQMFEKKLLREAFQDLLPSAVVWRTKEAFSDGVSSKEESWYQMIQRHVESVDVAEVEYAHNPPVLKETKWYRAMFETYYPGWEKVLPYYWLPRWTGSGHDPSARVLKVYEHANGSEQEK